MVHRSLSTRSLALATLALVVSCGGRGATTTSAPAGSGSELVDRALVQDKDLPAGLELRVSNGTAGTPGFDHTKLAPTKRLSDAEATALLSRAAPIATDPQDLQSFALRAGPLPPPRTGQLIKSSFPPPAAPLLAPVGNDAGALRVVRYMPEGSVPLAPELSVTFSQPMVAITSQGDAAATVPVKLSPRPSGRWRWIGTRTLLFDPAVRFPQATTYAVEIPAGTQSATGGALAVPVKFTFETPAPTLVAHYPDGSPQRRDVPMFALFDQKIDPAAVLSKISVKAAGTQHAIRMLAAAELARDKELASIVNAAHAAEQDGRWLAFRTVDELPPDTKIDVEISAGTPSAEGPNTTQRAQSFELATYPPLKIARAQCGWGGECRPGTAFEIELNNPLDDSKFDDSQIAISPALPDTKIAQHGNAILVMGAAAARTRYTVTLAGSVVDKFGQTLGTDAPLTWTVGDANPTFFGASGIVVVDPSAKRPTLEFFSTGYDQLQVKLYAVTPADYEAFCVAQRNQWNHDKPPVMPGRKVYDQRIATGGGANQLVETHVDLMPALAANGLGHVVAIVQPYPWVSKDEPAPQLITWAQSTRIGIDAYIDSDNLMAYATQLDTGKSAAGIALELLPYGIAGATDARGMASLALDGHPRRGAHLLVARKADDVAFVAEDSFWREDGSWFHQPRTTDLAWYVVDDRKMYKPGEEVSLKGWLRTIDRGKNGDVGWTAGAVSAVSYQVTDSAGNQLAKATAAVNPVGGFDSKFTLPKTPNLGRAVISFEAAGRLRGNYAHTIQIEEFRRPEFEVTAQASQGPFLVGGGGDVTVNAKYFAGGPLSGAPVNWRVTSTATSFTPPNRDDYVFGSWEPWWGRVDDGGRGGRFVRGGTPPKSWSLAGTTDATGAHTLHLDILSVKPALPMSVTVHAAVTDVNRQSWSASSALIVHPSAFYVGIKTKQPFVERGTPFDVDVIGVDLDGKPAIGAAIEVKVARLDWTYKRGAYATQEVEPQQCGLVAGAAPQPCSFHTAHGGTYQLTATIVDAQGRPNQTVLTFWVTGGDQPPARDVEQERVQLIPNKKDYAAGDTAELLVQAPFYPAEGVVSWRRSGIVKTEKIELDGPTKIIAVPISEAMVPNLVVQVDLVGMAARTDDRGMPDPKLPKRPAYAVGSIDLAVPPRQRTLSVTVVPSAAKLGPGESAQLAVTVVDARGRPVANAEAAVIVVDEAILALTGYQFPDPIGAFYGARGADTRDVYSQAYLKLAKPDAATLSLNARMGSPIGHARFSTGSPRGGAPPPSPMVASAMAAPMEMETPKMDRRVAKKPGATEEPAAQASAAIAIRSNFNPLAAFSPSVHTDAAGKAVIEIKLPDNLTRYRVVAIAVAGDHQFGKGESAVTARLPLMVRPSPPRFLNFGDTFQLPVVVQNQTDAAMTVRLAVRTTNATLTEGWGRELSVPANDRVSVQFAASAELAGTARFQIVGSSGSRSDAAELALPVWTPATTEAFATYGVIDDGAMQQPVALPGKVVTQFGGIEVTAASTNLQSLTDAMLYLVHYPFECAEQRSSRILAIAALSDVLAAFHAKDMPTVSAMQASVTADVEHLSQMQNGDGGFAYWDRGYPSEPYLTVYVASALVHARDKGFAAPPIILERATGYLRDIEHHYPAFYPPSVRWAISAYALYTRKQLGELDLAKAKKLLAEAGGPDKLSMEANGWLLGTFAQSPGATDERKAIVRHVLNRVSETAGAASFTTGYGDASYLLLASDRRVDAVVLESLIAEQPALDLIPKLVTGLLAHRKAGRWLNTQENTFALVALDRYFQTYEKTVPDFIARVWLGNDYAGDHAFKGRSTDTYAVDIAMKDVATHDRAALTIQKTGAGRLYYRIGMTYAPASLKLAAADHGFVVQRAYEAIDDASDVTRAADGTWHIKAGARVRVRLTLVNESRRYQVALVDPLPAGFETMNPALAVTGPIPMDPVEQRARGAYWWWYGPWYEHQNMRDERVEAFASLLWEGVHKYDYVARATTQGNFVVPPPRAEEMYMPETFGRGASDRVVIE